MAQNTQEKQLLTEVISALEKKYDVKFSYAVEDLGSIKIHPPNDSLNLQEAVAYLNTQTLLNFKMLNERYVTVSVLDKKIDICGYLKSAETNDALFGGTIAIAGETRGSTTSETGKFILNQVSPNAQILISYLGYESKTVIAKDIFTTSDCRTISLKPINENLDEIVIVKFLTTGLQKILDGSTVLNTKEFGILPGLTAPDILQSIQALPGVESANESIANINVRGGTNDQNLMLWDGIKMYHSGHFFGLISAYNPYLTEKVTVTKNGTSSEYSDGVSSTIKMETKDNITNEFSGGFGFDLISADAFLEIPLTENLELHVSARRSYTDIFNTPTYDRYFDRSFQDSDININSDNINEAATTSNFVFNDYSAKILYDFNENHQFRLSFLSIDNQLDYMETTTNTSDETISRVSELNQSNIGTSGNWKASWSDKLNTEFSGFYSTYMVDADDYRVESDQRLTQINEVIETGIKLKASYKWTENIRLNAGYQFNEIGILNETKVSLPFFERIKKDVLLNHAAFAEAEYKKENTYVRLGLRANYFQQFQKFRLEPRINIRQKLSNQFAVKFLGEFKNQSATQIVDFQDDFLGVENRRWILANNENIPIAESIQGSAGIEFNHNNLVIDVTGFYKNIDGITTSSQGFYNGLQFSDATGSYQSYGLEFLANKTADAYSAWISYTHSINDYTFDQFTPSKFPNNVDARHSVSAAFNYEFIKNLKISVGGIWRSGQPYTEPIEGNETVQNGNFTQVNYEEPNSSFLNNFKRLDASISYGFNIHNDIKGTLKAGVLNITNERNVINRYYEVDSEDNTKAKRVDNISLRMTPNVSFRVSF
ncbi:TonB-dependent receptor [Kordia antarctica]|nr:carboxypeptidase-like regulatory domain-containing protein [Kordia antarctica]